MGIFSKRDHAPETDNEMRLRKAVRLAESAHWGQKYGSLPYLHHCLMVSAATPPYDGDDRLHVVMKSAAVLHDVIEDSSVTREQIAEVCGTEVASLVWELTARPEEKDDASRDLEFTRLAGMSLPAKVIKCYDLACNMACCVVDGSPYLTGYVASWPRYEAALAAALAIRPDALESILYSLRVAGEPGKWTPEMLKSHSPFKEPFCGLWYSLIGKLIPA